MRGALKDPLASLRQQYDVDLVTAEFGGHLWDTMRLVSGSDVFLGMHGAGFAHLLWLRQVALNVPVSVFLPTATAIVLVLASGLHVLGIALLLHSVQANPSRMHWVPKAGCRPQQKSQIVLQGASMWKPCSPQGATVVQLFPYGFGLPDGSVIRERVYSGIADAVHVRYYRWVNQDAFNAHFRRCSHKRLQSWP